MSDFAFGDRVRLTPEAIEKRIWPCMSKRYEKMGVLLADITGTVQRRANKYGMVAVRWDRYLVIELIATEWLQKVSA